jgi:hypothetical protein
MRPPSLTASWTRAPTIFYAGWSKTEHCMRGDCCMFFEHLTDHGWHTFCETFDGVGPRSDHQEHDRVSVAFVIESAAGTAGVAVRIRGGFIFYASDSRYHHVDQRTFSNLRVLRAKLSSAAASRDSAQSRRASPSP